MVQRRTTSSKPRLSGPRSAPGRQANHLSDTRQLHTSVPPSDRSVHLGYLRFKVLTFIGNIDDATGDGRRASAPMAMTAI